MAGKKRLYRIAIIPAALLAVGVTGATLSQADASSSSGSSSCGSSGGLLSGVLCGVTTGVGGLLGGTTSTVTGVVGSTTGALTGGSTTQTSSGSGSTSSGSTSSGSTSSGSTSSGSTSSGSTSSGSTSSGSAGTTGSAGSTGGTSTGSTQPASTGAAPAGAPAKTAVPGSLKASRRALARLARLGHANSPAAKAPSTTVKLGSSQPAATRQVAAPRHSLWAATPLSLVIAATVGLTIGIGIVYAGWRNGDLFGRRRRYANGPAAS